MHEELARAGFVVIGYVAVRIRTNVHVKQERLAVLDEAVGVPEVCLAFADRFNLGTAEGHAGLELFQKEIVVAGHPVLGGIALAAGHGIPRARRLGRTRAVGVSDPVTGLTGHCYTSLNLHRSIGEASEICARAWHS